MECDTMTRTFDDDEAQRRDALYQALRPPYTFRKAQAHDRFGLDVYRDAELEQFKLAISARRQEVTPGDN
jgi:hypothetical protein